MQNMGTYAQDQEERRRMLRKYSADKQYLDCAEVILDAVPDVAVANLLGPTILTASVCTGAAVGMAAGAAFGPVSFVVGGGAGAAIGGYLGANAASKLEDSYCSASTDDRARMRRLGGKAAGGASKGYTAWKVGKAIVKFAR